MQTSQRATTTKRHARRPMPASTRPDCADLANQASAKTVRALYACFLLERREERGRRAKCNAAVDEFMHALYRITEHGDVLRLGIIYHLAPIVFALDARLDCDEAGVQLSENQVSAAIEEALAAAHNTQNWRL